MLSTTCAAVLALAAIGDFDETTIIVVAENGVPIVGAKVQVQQDESGGYRSVVTGTSDQDGSIRTTKIDPNGGRLRIRVSDAGAYANYSYDTDYRRLCVIVLKDPKYTYRPVYRPQNFVEYVRTTCCGPRGECYVVYRPVQKTVWTQVGVECVPLANHMPRPVTCSPPETSTPVP
ncbi:MAG: hypothetical protein WED34_02475 [Planctomycetales bacterium]